MLDGVRRLLSSRREAEPAVDWKKRGNELLAQGQLAGAIDCYRQAAGAAPADAAARVNLGFAFLEQQSFDEAARWLQEALRIDARQHEALFLLARARRGQGDAAGALQAYASALAIDGSFAIAAEERNQLLAHLGQEALNANEPQQAREWFRQWAEAAPADASAHAHVGLACESLDDWPQAERSYAAALQRDAGQAQALFGMGNVLMQKSEAAGAVECYTKVLASLPEHVLCAGNLAQALAACKRYDAAEAAYRRWLALAPGDCKAQLGLARALSQLERYDEAQAAYAKGLANAPATPEICIEQGYALQQLGRLGESEERLRQALALRPRDVLALVNLGSVLQEMGRPREAAAAHQQALAQQPDHAAAHWNHALCRLVLGDLDIGWHEAEWRWQALKREPLRTGRPTWTGDQPIAGKTILVYAEQGLGDTIQFCRYAKLLVDRDARVVLVVQPAVEGLIRTLQVPCAIQTTIDNLPPHDYACALLSLPLALRTSLETVPADIPYLSASPGMVESWQQRLGPTRARRVGIAWSGNATHVNDRNRSMRLADLQLAMPGVELVSLQKEVREADLAALRDGRIAHFGEHLTDFRETAALVACMDLVVSVDTSVAHLAGALGKPVWILLPFNPDWRWLLQRQDTPWYPTARLFRQPRIGDWGAVLQELRTALSALPPATQPTTP